MAFRRVLAISQATAVQSAVATLYAGGGATTTVWFYNAGTAAINWDCVSPPTANSPVLATATWLPVKLNTQGPIYAICSTAALDVRVVVETQG